MLPVSGSSQSQAACEGSGAGSRDGPRWDVRSLTPQSPLGTKGTGRAGLVMGSVDSPKHSKQ